VTWFSRRPSLEPDECDRLAALEKRLKVIEADWDEWYDKFRRLYARLSKRVERDEQTADVAPGAAYGRPKPQSSNPLARRLLEGRQGHPEG
jgi:hypothetical protein